VRALRAGGGKSGNPGKRLLTVTREDSFFRIKLREGEKEGTMARGLTCGCLGKGLKKLTRTDYRRGRREKRAEARQQKQTRSINRGAPRTHGDEGNHGRTK